MSKINDSKYYQAEIHGISNDKSCLHDSTTNISVWIIIIKNYFKNVKKKYHGKLNIKHVILTDNSLKFCKNINDSIQLSLMLTLLIGHTWYGKYGYDNILLDNYNKNIDIINNITIEKANILKYIELTSEPHIIDAVKKILKTNPNMLLKDFLTNFFKFYELLFQDIGLFDF